MGYLHADRTAGGRQRTNPCFRKLICRYGYEFHQVFPGWTSKAYDGLKEGRRIELDNKDYRITETDFPKNVISVGATVRQSNVTLTYGQDYVSTTLEGVYPNHKDVERVKPAGGRFINDIDIRQRRKVIILHTKTAEMLFKKDADKAIGKFVNANGVVYQVVGLFTDKGSFQPNAFIPFTTLQLIYNKGDKLNNLIFMTQGLDTEEKNEIFEKEYRKAIGVHHRFTADDKGAIWMWNRFTQIPAQEKRYAHSDYSHLGNRHIHFAEWHRRCK